MTAHLVKVSEVMSVVAYDAMCHKITQCETLAECKDIADKAAALKEYARRMKNLEAERRALNVRLIAERQYGALLKDLARATPADAGKASGAVRSNAPRDGDRSAYAQALADTGVSTQSASRYQALAAVPQEVFDKAISDGDVTPTVRAMIAKLPVAPKMPSDVLAVWGCMRDFERDGLFAQCDLAAMVSAMTESMQRDAARLVPQMIDFFQRLHEAIIETRK